VHPVRKPWWQQATALVTVTTGGMITGFNFVPGAAATMTSPTSVPLHLLALEQAGRPGTAMNARVVGGDSADSATGNALLRSAIVNVAKYYLQLAATRTPAQLESLIWDNTSLNGADHGPSCAAFASLTLELAAQAVGQQSWVSGGTSYPWPMPAWADVRVDENPDSPDITSMVQDAQAHDRWQPIGDGYRPQPGDWVLFDQHVEVVTSYSNGVLDTIGADSAPNLSVNAHSIDGDLAAAGVAGFIDNGNLAAATSAAVPTTSAATDRTVAPSASATEAATSGGRTGGRPTSASGAGLAVVPGVVNPVVPQTFSSAGTDHDNAAYSAATIPGAAPVVGDAEGASVIPGASPAAAAPTPEPSKAAPPAAPATAPATAPAASTASPTATPTSPTATPSSPATTPSAPTSTPSSPATTPTSPATPAATAATPAATSTANPEKYRQHSAPAMATPGTRSQQAFISLIAPGAEAAQQRWGVPAAVTIAQAIEESAWGNSQLAAQYHNLFGIKGTGPAGTVALPTSEYLSGQWVTIDAQFRVYHNVAESIADHAELLATSGYYQRAMADRSVPDAFANDLTGVYATDPDYGANLIAIMKLYNLYRFDSPTVMAPTAAAQPTAAASVPASPAHAAAAATASAAAGHQAPAAHPAAASEAQIPGLATPALAPTPTPTPTTATATAPPRTATAAAAPTAAAGAAIPGVVTQQRAAASAAQGAASIPGLAAAATAPAAASANYQRQPSATAATSARYQPQLPHAMTTAYFATAKGPLAHGEHLYRDVAQQMDISWKLLAACDWMQCKAHPRYSPVHGEKIGTLNSDGTSYSTKSAALAQCASDLIELAAAVYGIDLTARRALSVRALADAFAAFRWGALLRRHRVSAMEFPYAVAGLTAQHLKMHWPVIDDPAAPDRPGARFREPFGAVPVVLSLDYPATV